MIKVGDLPLKEINKNFHIPPKPAVLVELHKIMASPEPDIVQMAALISQDVGLSSAVLKTINSAYYGMRRQVSDIRQAAILLGPPALVNLVTTYELRNAMPGDCPISLERFWDSAEDVAKIGALLVQQLDLRIPMEDVYTAGLFHDCGIPVMALQYPDYQKVLVEANSNYDKSMTLIEEEHYGLHHSVMGYLIADTWDLPEIICQTILQNHERDIWQVKDKPVLIYQVAVLKLSENISDKRRRYCESPDWAHHKTGALKVLGIAEDAYQELETKTTDTWVNIESKC